MMQSLGNLGVIYGSRDRVLERTCTAEKGRRRACPAWSRGPLATGSRQVGWVKQAASLVGHRSPVSAFFQAAGWKSARLRLVRTHQ